FPGGSAWLCSRSSQALRSIKRLAKPVGPGGGDIGVDRRSQRLQGGETLLVAQLVVKLHRQSLAVEVASEIQQMHFQVRAAVARHRRALADVGHALEPLPPVQRTD